MALSIKQTFKTAISAHKSGRLLDASALYQDVLAEAPNHKEAMQGLAAIMIAQGHWARATVILERLSHVEPNSPVLWHTLSMAAAKHRNYTQAIEAYERFMAVTPPSAQHMLAFADLLLIAHELERSIDALDKAQTLGSDNVETHYMSARQLMLKGDIEGAKAALTLAHAHQPDHSPSWQLRVDISSTTEIEDGLASLKAATLAAKDHDTASRLHYALGCAHQKLHHYDQAFDAFLSANRAQNERLLKAGQAYDRRRTTAEVDGLMSLYPRIPQSQAQHTNAQRPIFILGMPRTGTTLVERILASLEGVSAGGENEAMEFIAAQYYHDMGRNVAAPPMDVTPAKWSDMADDYWQRTPTSTPITTDKMPHNFRHIGLILAMFPDAPILFMRRDPRDVALSIFTRIFPDGHSYACDLKALAHFYNEHERLHAHWLDIAPERIMDVNYNMLVTEPEAMTKSIAAHCGLNWSADCLNFHTAAHASYTFSELQVRQPVNTKGLERWRTYESQLGPFIDELETK